jgi:AcrR family transcriptional regulator
MYADAVTKSVSRRQEYAAATREALVESAMRLFVDRGFASTSLEQVAVDARVTRGAVYHHFANKQALFQAVLEAVDAQTMASIVERSGSESSTWDAAVAGFDAFLDRCLDLTYQRICFEEGPGAMGFVAWWEHGEQHVAGLLKAVLGALRDENLVDLDDVDALATVIYGALAAGAIAIARADRPRVVRDEIRATIIRMVEGLRATDA